MAEENLLYSKGEPLKKHRFTLKLTDSTYEKFKILLKDDKTTVAEVLEGFINDLVCGSYTRGSDERMLAYQYYERCGYPYYDEMYE